MTVFTKTALYLLCSWPREAGHSAATYIRRPEPVLFSAARFSYAPERVAEEPVVAESAFVLGPGCKAQPGHCPSWADENRLSDRFLAVRESIGCYVHYSMEH